MNTIDLIIESATTFYNELHEDQNGRYRSWEHCYKAFHDARGKNEADTDYLSLQLAFYLASWGMYRGSSFLLQKDYKIHIPVVEEILRPEYNKLFGIHCSELKKDENQNALKRLEENTSSYYSKVRADLKDKKEVKNNLSTTLITKVLMGTLGCVPAYDRYFIDGIKSQKVSTGNFNIKSLLLLVDFYKQNEKELEIERNKMEVYGLPYPQMKLLDMGFWYIGYERDSKKSISAH